jgi:preprotein translocase subunit SecE
VIATVFIFAAFFELVDVILGTGIDKIFSSLIKH